MAKKKKAKVTAVLPKKQTGFFERTRGIIKEEAPQKSVRVKTFIVEKPIIIHDKPTHISSGGVVGEEEDFDFAQKKKYPKKFRGVDLKDGADLQEDGGRDSEEDFGEDLGEVPADEFGGEEGLVEEEDLGQEEGVDNFGQKNNVKHLRSRGMIMNVWWKKAILWAVLVWLLILVFEVIMWLLKLIENINFERQWWFLLAGLLVVSLIYFGLLEGRVKI